MEQFNTAHPYRHHAFIAPDLWSPNGHNLSPVECIIIQQWFEAASDWCVHGLECNKALLTLTSGADEDSFNIHGDGVNCH